MAGAEAGGGMTPRYRISLAPRGLNLAALPPVPSDKFALALPRIVAITNLDNIASQRVLLKVGLHRMASARFRSPQLRAREMEWTGGVLTRDARAGGRCHLLRAEIHIVLNWTEELKRLVPTK